MTINEWAIKHGVSFDAVEDLRRLYGMSYTPPNQSGDKSESAVQVDVRLEASEKGLRLWRNNVGVLLDARGVPVRYGLANESKQMNSKIKSSDLIGVRPVRIEPRHVGSVIGQFVAREIKPEYWNYSGNAHEIAQLKFLELVLSMGGDAAFANKRGTL